MSRTETLEFLAAAHRHAREDTWLFVFHDEAIRVDKRGAHAVTMPDLEPTEWCQLWAETPLIDANDPQVIKMRKLMRAAMDYDVGEVTR